MAKTKTARKYEQRYIRALNRMVDKLFQEAYARNYTWEQLADKAGIARQTVVHLGKYYTRTPHFRTVELIAQALGGSLIFKNGKVAGFQQRTHKIRRLTAKDVKLKIHKPRRVVA